MKNKILIVDDDSLTLKILKKYLENDFDVITEDSGHKFIENLESYDVDLVLLDVEMPVISGVDAFERMSISPRTRHIPVVFMTGVSSPKIVRELMQRGAIGCLPKTTPREEMVKKVKKFLTMTRNDPEVAKEVLVLEGDTSLLKSMRSVLVKESLVVRTARSIVETVDILNTYTPELIIIGNDSYGYSSQEAYDSLVDILRSKSIRTIVLEKQYFEAELIDRVKRILK